MEEIDLREVFSYFKSKIAIIIVTIALILVVGNVYTNFVRVPMYQSNTTIVLVNETKGNYNPSELQLNKNLIGTYSEIIKSRKVLSQVIENLELKTSVDQLAESITVTSVTDTEIIRITVNNQNNELARNITDEVADVFVDEIDKIYDLENIAIIDRANISDKAFNVNPLKDNMIFFLVGLVLSSGVVFTMYYFDTTIKSSEVVEEKLGLTVLGIVPSEGRVK